jgi:hypothetical protein
MKEASALCTGTEANSTRWLTVAIARDEFHSLDEGVLTPELQQYRANLNRGLSALDDQWNPELSGLNSVEPPEWPEQKAEPRASAVPGFLTLGITQAWSGTIRGFTRKVNWMAIRSAQWNCGERALLLTFINLPTFVSAAAAIGQTRPVVQAAGGLPLPELDISGEAQLWRDGVGLGNVASVQRLDRLLWPMMCQGSTWAARLDICSQLEWLLEHFNDSALLAPLTA